MHWNVVGKDNLPDSALQLIKTTRSRSNSYSAQNERQSTCVAYFINQSTRMTSQSSCL